MITRELRRLVKHPLVSGAAVLSTAQYASVAVGLITSVVVARWLGPDSYGTAAVIMSFPSLLWSFMSVKPVSVTTRYIAGFRATSQVDDLLGTCKLGYSLDFAAATAVLLITVLVGWWVSQNVYGLSDGYQLAVIYAISFPFAAFQSTSESILLSWEKYLWLAAIPVMQKTSVLILSLIMLWQGEGVRGFVIGTSIGQAVTGLFALILATVLVHGQGFGFWWRGSIRTVTYLRKELASFFGMNYVIVTLSGAMIQIPLLMLARISGPADAAFYRISTNLVTVASYLETTLNKVAYSSLSALWKSGQRSAITPLLRAWSLKAGVPAALILLLFAAFILPLLVPFLYGNEYEQVVLGTQILFVAAAFRALVFWLDGYYFASGRIQLFTIVFVIFGICTFGFAWLAIQLWGFIGLCLVVAIGRVVYSSFLVAKV